MLGRRSFLAGLSAAPSVAKAAVEEGMEVALDSAEATLGDHRIGPELVKVWPEDRATLELQQRYSEQQEESYHRVYYQDFSDMKSWSKRFREEQIMKDKLKRYQERRTISSIIYDNSTTYAEKLAKLMALGFKI